MCGIDFIDIIAIPELALLCFLLFLSIYFLLIIAIPDSAFLPYTTRNIMYYILTH